MMKIVVGGPILLSSAKVMVIGANGLLGVNLCNDLSKFGAQNIIAVDRFANKERFQKTPNIIGVRSSLSDLVIQPEIFAGIDAVVYLASGLSPGINIDEVELFHRKIVFQELLDVLHRFGVPKFLFASTGGAMFGESTNFLHTEEESPSPISQYAQEKLTFETALLGSDFSKQSDCIIFRGSNFYGSPYIPRKNHGVIPSLINCAVTGADFTLIGSGNEVRDFIDVRDVSRMVIELISNSPNSRIYNLCSGNGTTINEVIQITKKISGSQFKIKQIQAPSSYVNKSVLDPGLFTREFGRRAEISLEAGIEHLWESILAEGPL